MYTLALWRMHARVTHNLTPSLPPSPSLSLPLPPSPSLPPPQRSSGARFSGLLKNTVYKVRVMIPSNPSTSGPNGFSADWSTDSATASAHVLTITAPPCSSFACYPFVEAGVTGNVNEAGPGQGMAVGDYDGDGHLDIYVANYRGGNKLYKGVGDGTFTDVTATAGVGDDIPDSFYKDVSPSRGAKW
jgi:hypothetical protein